MSASRRISRRTMLRGMGAAVSLPLLDIMDVRGSAQAAPKPTVRAAYLYFPNGVADGSWQPRQVDEAGRLVRLNEWMQPLEAFKRDIIIPKNLWTPHGNGHGAGTATWLTGGGYDAKRIDAGGVSADQLAARAIGHQTLLPSLELSMKGEGFFSNNLPRNTISWTSSGTPAPREFEPRAVFDRMFNSGRRGGADRSVLDRVASHARSLRREASRSDQRKIDEYLEAIRAIERRLEFADRQTQLRIHERAASARFERPAAGFPADHTAYMRLMLDMVVLAFWADATRVCTFMLDHGQSNRYFNFVDGVKGTWHALSHYRDASGKTEDDDGITSWDSVTSKRDMYNAVTRWHHEQVAYFLHRLQSVPEGDGTLLDHAMILYGSSLADGDKHYERNLPLILVGRGGGTIRSGRQLAFADNTSMSNLHLAMLRRLGVKVDAFGGSREPMTEIDA